MEEREKMENDVIKLIAQTVTVNAVGDSIMTETEREVFAKVESIGLKRKLEAQEAGLKLAYKFTLSDAYEYEDEEILEYKGTRYNIVNVYINQFQEPELLTAKYLLWACHLYQNSPKTAWNSRAALIGQIITLMS